MVEKAEGGAEPILSSKKVPDEARQRRGQHPQAGHGARGGGVTDFCPTCHQPLPSPTSGYLTDRELVAVSAWWWMRHERGAARLAGVAVQTLKNQLARARQRNRAKDTQDLAFMHLERLLSREELSVKAAQHNARREAA